MRLDAPVGRLTAGAEPKVCGCPHTTHQHGTVTMYANCRSTRDGTSRGCRCRECTDAMTVARRESRRRKLLGQAPGYVDAGPTIRAVRGLHAQGYPMQWIADRMGCNIKAFEFLTPRVHRRLDAAARDLAARYGHVPGPSARARTLAARKGWTADLLYDDPIEHDDVVDEVAVARAIAGQPAALTRREQREAARVLDGRGHSAAEIAARTGYTARTITRHRTAQGVADVAA